ncbi:MAG: BTAD domain-containing putative transcriptional regulator, partial [Chloroflexota bacterium]
MTPQTTTGSTLNLLGPPAIYVNRELVKISSQKALAILFYVALAKAPVPRTTLIGLLWPESTEASAKSNFRTQLGVLRKSFDDALAISRSEIGINDGVQIDAKQLLEMSADASLDQLQHYLSLWRGEFLEGFEVSGSAEFDWWLTEMREHLRYQVVVAAERAVYLAEAEQKPEVQLDAARRWVTLSPLQEAAHRAVMQAHLSLGNRSEAIKQYKLCAQLLQAELDLAPSFETKLIYDQILAADQEPEPVKRPIWQEQSDTAKLKDLLLKKTGKFWFDSILKRNVPDSQYIQILSEPRPELVDHPWGDVLGDLLLTQGWRPDSNIETLFSLAGQRLLITGEPGAGKSIALLKLAESLAAATRNNADEPIPLILNLSTWANEQVPFKQWVLGELQSKYGIPADVGQDWLNTDQFVYLLDGLDEMPNGDRPKAVATINAWLQDADPAGVVVCCRLADYEAIGQKLQLLGAVRLLPLTAEQVETALAENEDSLAAITDLNGEQKQSSLSVASSPMMLNLIQRLPVNSYQSIDQIIGQYVTESFKRKPISSEKATNYPDQLSQLAQNMLAHNQTIFLLEDLQPSWLESKWERLTYLLSTRAIIGTLGSIEYSLFAFVLLIIAPNTEIAIVDNTAAWLNLTHAAATFITFLIICMVAGLVGAWLDFWRWENGRLSNQTSADRLKKSLIAAAIVAIPIGLFGNWVVAGIYALLFSSSTFVAGITWLSGSSYQTDIHADEALGWSWVQAGWGAVFGTVMAFLVTRFFATDHIALSFFTITVTMVLLFGMKGKRLTESTRPNQGMLVTLNNGLAGGSITTLMLFAAVALVAGWQNGLLVGALVGLSVMFTQGL